jgi:NhaP-type Na+/H+ or K+/H+ antiporter
LLDIMITLLAEFVAYFLAEQLHESGVLAAMSCGLLHGRKQHAEFTAVTRLAAATVKEFITALVFMLIGLQLRGIVERLEGYDSASLAMLGLAYR